jgi:hypothetical protein
MALILLIPAGAVAGDWLPVGTGQPQMAPAQAPYVQVQDDGREGFELMVDVLGLELIDQQTDAGTFVELTLPDSPLAGQIGAPGIAVVRRIFVAPPDATVTFDVQTEGLEVLDAAAVGRRLLLAPVQPPIEKLPGAIENAPFIYDAQAYAGISYGTARATVTELGVMHGQRLMLLEVWPVAYDTATEQVTLYPRTVVNVSFAGGTPATMSAPAGLAGVVANPSLLPAGLGSRGGNYLILVASTYAGQIGDFVTFKQNQGFNVTVQEVAAGASAATIKNYITGLYGGANSPDYVLLIGDTNTIPSWTGGGAGSPATDLNYVCMDGTTDWYPDIPIGRFSTQSPTDLTNMIEKTIDFELGLFADPDYVLRAVFMASEDNYQVSEGTHNYVINNYMIPNGIESDKLYCHTYNATMQQVRNAFNDGRIYGIYSGHGGTTSWGDGPPFSASDVGNLTNYQLYPFVCSFACVTGQFTASECFTETWLREENKGAIAIYGSSVNSYWTEDDILEKKLFDVIYDPENPQREVSPAWQGALVRYLEYFGSGSTTRRYFEMYNLMGDPSLYLPGPGAVDLAIDPAGGLIAEGQPGGPFTPDGVTYTLTNNTDEPLTYSATADQTWVTVGNGAGTLPVDGTAEVTVTVNSTANSFGYGTYVATVEFVNETSHVGDATRLITLKVGVPTSLLTWPLDENPGWSAMGQWAFGQPAGSGGVLHPNPDPTAGATGAYVYGVNLSGDYSVTPGGPYYLSMGPVDLTGLTETSVRFQRWLNSDYQPYVKNTVEVSVDGTTWTEVWANANTAITDSAWTPITCDISALANNQLAVYVRWGYRIGSAAWAYSGWNIDDVAIWGLPGEPEYTVGDLNCDGLVDNFDIRAFVVALNATAPDYPEYYDLYPGCDRDLADVNGDDIVDNFDISPFVNLLVP